MRKRDGIYNPNATAVLKSLSDTAEGRPAADANVFEWYEERFPQSLEGCHVIDWGAGVGRFVAFYRARGAARITLIEPSEAAGTTLRSQFGAGPDIEVIREGLGAQVSRSASPAATVHACNFVVNCLESLDEAFRLLTHSILPEERLFLFTNVFAPASLVESIRSPRAADRAPVDLMEAKTLRAQAPRATTFTNARIGSGQVFTDSVHTLAEFGALVCGKDSAWTMREASLMLPDGFQHVIAPGEDFGDHRFAVLAAELVRR
jgi:hypothetical protein